jgi:predicted porin
MNRNLTVFAMLSLVGGLASAQSSVTLYGVVDVAVERIKGATSLVRLSSGQQQGSRWGLRGVEDLGGGLKASFVLEAGFNADLGTSGQGGRMFGRQAFLGLGGGWGTVRLGRQYTPMDDIAGIVGTKGYDVLSVVPIIGNGDYNRVNNAITYLSPALAGTVFQLQYSLGEERASTDASADFDKQVSAHALYTKGPLTAGLGLMKVTDANGTTAGKQPTTSGRSRYRPTTTSKTKRRKSSRSMVWPLRSSWEKRRFRWAQRRPRTSTARLVQPAMTPPSTPCRPVTTFPNARRSTATSPQFPMMKPPRLVSTARWPGQAPTVFSSE